MNPFLDCVDNVERRFDWVGDVLPYLMLLWCLPILAPLAVLGWLIGGQDDSER